ncbi:MAG: efflux RND transporter periplasmic adaptor subunit [Legionella sp.]|nr:efflux RND transporter periplasmic adaptor subunit [Legionella sp.]
MNKSNLIFFLFSLIVLAGIPACHKSKKKEASHSLQSYKVTTEAMHKSLYFTGTMQPLKESAITSPVEGVVEALHYHYGQWVKQDEAVLSLRSSELQKQYNETLTDYLKAKDNYTLAKTKFAGTEALWQAGLLAKNNYIHEKSSVDTARITLMESTRKLHETLAKIDGQPTEDLTALSLSEFSKVRQALTTEHQTIHLKAPACGVLLYPTQSSDDKAGKLRVGSTLKAGQVVAVVGDLSGVSIEIDVPEVDIDKVHPGMTALITGLALGKERLEGKLSMVNVQATQASGGLPSFKALIEVKTLTKAQQARVKIGMSATIEVPMDGQEQLMIPIAAIEQYQGKSLVVVKGLDGKLKKQPITTGSALADKVVVLDGLQAGDILEYQPNS